MSAAYGSGRVRRFSLLAVLAVAALGAGPPPKAPRPAAPAQVRANQPLGSVDPTPPRVARASNPLTIPASSPASNPDPAPGPAAGALSLEPQQVFRSVSTVALVAAASLAPAAVLMLTAFVRINIVLVLLRQALGSQQVPGNQVLTALALLLTALVMRPTGETVYRQAVAPYRAGGLSAEGAVGAAARPVKEFMLRQVERTGHAHYLWDLYDQTAEPGRPEPQVGDDFPFTVVASAYLLSELTTALVIGFYLYLPFLVVDLVVSAVLAAMGLFMLPPSLVALPLKLILFVAVDGWLRVATMLMQSFGPTPAAAG